MILTGVYEIVIFTSLICCYVILTNLRLLIMLYNESSFLFSFFFFHGMIECLSFIYCIFIVYLRYA